MNRRFDRWARRAGVVCISLLVVIGLPPTPAHADMFGDYTFCSPTKATVSGSATRSLVISGSCQGKSLRLSGSVNRRTGSYSVRGYLGGSQVRISGYVKGGASAKGYIGSERVDMSGSADQYLTSLQGWIGNSYDTARGQHLIAIICSSVAWTRR